MGPLSLEKSLICANLDGRVSKNQLTFLINSLNGGGAERLTIQLSEALGNAPIVLLENIVDYPIDKLPVVRLSSGKAARSLLRYLALPGLAQKLAAKTNTEGVIVASLFRAYLVAWLAKKLFGGGDYICWVHNDTKHYTRKPLIAWLYRQVFSAATGLVVNSVKAKEDLIINKLADGDKVHTIYNFFDVDDIKKKATTPVPVGVKLPESPFYVVMGRLHPVKGHGFMLDLMAQLENDAPVLVIIGSGEEEEKLKTKAEALNIGSRVHFLGFQPNPYAIMKQATALISASKSEGFGNVLVEAMICGVPVISSDIDSGPREILAPDSRDLTRRTLDLEVAKFGILLPGIDGDNMDQRQAVWYRFFQKLAVDTTILIPFINLPVNAFSSFDKAQIVKQWEALVGGYQKEQ